MKNNKLEKIMEIGESIIDNATDKTESESILKVYELDSLTAFMLGASIILHGIDATRKGCELIVDKSIKLITESEEPEYYN